MYALFPFSPIIAILAFDLNIVTLIVTHPRYKAENIHVSYCNRCLHTYHHSLAWTLCLICDLYRGYNAIC